MTNLNCIEASDCCWAEVTDSWLCSDCKEHCSTIITKDVSVWVLDYTTPSVSRNIITIEYNEDESDSEHEVEQRLSELYPNHSLEWMRADGKELNFDDLDYR